jgi:hypothetical protein
MSVRNSLQFKKYLKDSRSIGQPIETYRYRHVNRRPMSDYQTIRLSSLNSSYLILVQILDSLNFSSVKTKLP